jgi:putative flippase GtrA
MHLFANNPRFWEFVRHSVVGFSSTVIDFATLALLTTLWTWPPLAANPVSFSLGVTNGFYWNRHWTFQGARHEEPVGQYVRFVLVNLGGVLIDQAVLAGALALGPDAGLTAELSKWAGKVAAIPFVVTWNFTANSYWTFRRRRQPPATPDRAVEHGPRPRR